MHKFVFFKGSIFGLVGILIIAVLGYAGWKIWFEAREVETGQEQLASKDNSSEPLPSKELSAPEIDTSRWKTYRDEKYGFQIKLPEDWTAELAQDYFGLTEFVLIGGPEYPELTGDVRADILFPEDINKAIDRIGDQFTERMVEREEVTVNGLDALLVTVTTPDDPSWKATSVFIVGQRYIYEIGIDPEDSIERAVLTSFTILP